MAGDGGFAPFGRYWQMLKELNIAAEREQKPLLPGRDASVMVNGGGFLHRECGVPESTLPMEFMRDGWMSPRDRLFHGFPGNQNFPFQPEGSGDHNSHIPPPLDSPKVEQNPQIEEEGSKEVGPIKKRSNGRGGKAPKAKKSKRNSSGLKDDINCSVPRPKPDKVTGVVINGVDIDISGIPIPVCSCTGAPQQCYRWGCGGWQSACCTTSISMYPLPLSTKRRGARIAGRKMSQGAFKKVLEKLMAEGYNLSNPIDLKTHWAKHGTNKFVTIR